MKIKLLQMTLLIFLYSAAYADNAVLFVSLGMPDNTLKRYFIQAKECRIPVVIRGLYSKKDDKTADKYVGSFKDTANRIFKLIKNKKLGGVSIDPMIFKSFNIRVVPALVIYDDGLSCLHNKRKPLCKSNRYSVIYGNTPLRTQLKTVISRTNHKGRLDYAQTLLDNCNEKRESDYV